MAKTINKWSKTRSKTLAKNVRLFNQKIARTAKKHPEIAEYLPEKVSVKELKQMINTESDYRKVLNSLKSWRKRGAEKIVETKGGATVTKWALNEAKKNKEMVNKRREKINKEFNAAPVYIDGEEMTNVERMVEQQEVKPLTKDIEKLNQKDFKDFAKWLNRERLDEKQLNKGVWFIQDISEVFYSQFSANHANFLIRLLHLVGGDIAYSLYHDKRVTELQPEWHYSDPIEEEEKVERLTKVLFEYLDENQIEQLMNEYEIAKEIILQTPPNKRINNKKWAELQRKAKES